MAASTDRIAGFLRDIGIAVHFEPVEGPTFLPGLTIRDGAIVADRSRLTYPGDLLHEAGHLAMLPPEIRVAASAPLPEDLGLEIGAMAWSWAALMHLELEPAVVFHDGGYRGGGANFIENFNARRFVGVPLLQWMGMTTEAEFPRMHCWLRPSSAKPAPDTPPRAA